MRVFRPRLRAAIARSTRSPGELLDERLPQPIADREQAGVGEKELGRVQLSGAQAGTADWDDVDEEDRAQKLDVGGDGLVGYLSVARQPPVVQDLCRMRCE